MDADTAFAFGRFRLLPSRRQLLADDQPVAIGARALDLLQALVERRDRMVTKDELLDLVWAGVVVEEANLHVQISALRKLLGPNAIATLPGRGYRFVEPLRDEAALPPAPVVQAAPASLLGLGAPLIGRDDALQTLTGLLRQHPLLSIVGPAGVGKTRVARQLAGLQAPRFAHGACWVELAPLSDPALVPAAVARALGMTGATASTAAVAAMLHTAPVLLVLDNAEHVLPGAAALASAVSEHAPEAQVLVTSQEPLHCAGEHTFRLEPLSLPANESLDGARASGAVALFELRAQPWFPGFRVDETRREAVVDVCRRLDGIPLALELAAARLPLLGLDGLRERLDERFRLLASKSPQGLPRHQTLRAAVEWSHGLLEETEQRVLRRLGVFAGGFTLAAAQAVARDDTLDAWQVLDAVGTLVDKSLVVSQGDRTPRFSLLETTRLYALERLDAAGETGALQEAHARAFADLWWVRTDDARLWRTPPAPQDVLAAEVDNARAALAWASRADDDVLAVRLAACTSHVFLSASLNAEYLHRVLPLRSRVDGATPPDVAALFWARIALACSRNAHPAGFDAALAAAGLYRRIGDRGRLYDALTWAVAIGSRLGQESDLQSLVDEAIALEDAAWPAAFRSSFQWAQHRWLLAQGRPQEALQCALRQAELLEEEGSWIAHVALGANVADCELTLGRIQAAEARSRHALDALAQRGIDANLVGHVMDARMVALTLLNRCDDAIAQGRQALPLLQREGDDLRLLDTLALNALHRGRGLDAATLAAYVDKAMAATGEQRWPAAASRRRQLDRRLDAALDKAQHRHARSAAERLTRDQAFALAFGAR